MNDNYIKEYEEMSLCDLADELVEPLFTIKKDLAKTIYIHYAEERDKNYELQQENKHLKEHIEKYERYCKTTGIEELMKNKKYKEVIDKAIEYIEDTYYSKNTTDIDSIVLSNNELLKIRKILKGVE